MGKVSSLAEHGLPLWLQLQLSVRTGQIESVATIVRFHRMYVSLAGR